ncbi:MULTISPECIES: hypothetical protein [Bacillus cereus group]|uniref:hypothetical protein n=1 Tax=Bacillus TaxID=1386 RepID=UPI00124C400D|nr:hypothetical protein [Bacillus cereus]KAB2422120.1 hypothetical protein F8167_16915 [Bacillus cereus]
MIWFFVPLLTTVILSIIILWSFYTLEVDNNIETPSKFLMFLVRIFEWVLKFLSHAFFVSIVIWIGSLLFLIGLLLIPKPPQLQYLFLVGISIFFAYAMPIITHYPIKLASKLNNSEYTRNIVNKYKSYLGKSNYRIATYFILLLLYVVRNFRDFSKLKNPDILKVSAEALLTFVIIDTMITIYNEKRSK